MTSLTEPSGKRTTYTYDADNVRTKTSYPGGISQTTTVDKAGRPTRVTATSGSKTLKDYTYSYAYTAGGKTADGTKIRTRTLAGGLTNAYTYDSQGRLTLATETDTNGKRTGLWRYCWDKTGNLTASSGHSESCDGAETTYSYNDADEITARNGDSDGWAYDKAGNEASAPSPLARSDETYNDFGQLTSLKNASGKAITARYAGTDNSERVRIGDTAFHNTATGLAAATDTAHGTDTGFLREPSGTLNGMTLDGRTYHYLLDGQGSVVAVADEDGNLADSYEYAPTGTLRSGGGDAEKVKQPFKYASYYYQDDWAYYLRARYFDQKLLRFTQPDPSGQETHPYLYANGDPVNHTDPNGLFGWKTFFSTIGTAVTVGGGAGAAGSCVIAGTASGGVGCPLGAGIGAGLGSGGGFLAGIPLGIWQGWGE